MPFPRKVFLFFVLISLKSSFCQNSMVGDGFGGRLWYQPTSFGVGSYTGFNICKGNDCDSITNQLLIWGVIGRLAGNVINGGTDVPIPMPGMTNIKYFSSGYCTGIIKKDGTGWVNGINYNPIPRHVINDVTFLDAAINSISFVKNDGTVWSIGDNHWGNFGDGTTISDSTSPVQMLGINNAVRVANGTGTTYILLANGKVKAAGCNGGANANAVLLGTGSYLINETLAMDVIGLSNIVDIKAHSMATAALDNLGNVYVWGNGNFIGDGDNTNEYVPKKITALHDIVSISACADGLHFLALDKNKNCYAWGEGGNQFGITNFTNNSILSPTIVATDVIDIMAGETFSYIVKSDGSLWATGASLYGSIWLNLPNVLRTTFTKLDPELTQGWCSLPNSSINSTPSCSNIDNGTITINHTSGLAPYQFNIGNGNQNNNAFCNVGIGNYTVTITDANACVTSLETQISSMDPTVVVNNVSVCFGDTATLYASGANSYSWTGSGNLNSTVGATVLASPTNTSTYTVTGTSNNGCIDSAISIVTIVPLPIFNSINDTICKGEQVVLNSFGGINYTWSPSNGLTNSNSGSVIASPSSNTTYTLNADNGQCITTFTVHIQVKPKPIANFESNFTDNIELNSTLQLNNTSILTNSFEWQLCNNAISSNDTVSLALNYEGVCCIKLKAETNSCYDSITKCFNVYDPFTINIPNVFSPNNDGKNDFYFVTGTGIKSFHCDIFNRWGQKIYEWDGLNGFWDGKTKTGIANDGTYYFNIDCSLKDSNFKNFHGFITLTR